MCVCVLQRKRKKERESERELEKKSKTVSFENAELDFPACSSAFRISVQ